MMMIGKFATNTYVPQIKNKNPMRTVSLNVHIYVLVMFECPRETLIFFSTVYYFSRIVTDVTDSDLFKEIKSRHFVRY